jgi:hypothetical protein
MKRGVQIEKTFDWTLHSSFIGAADGPEDSEETTHFKDPVLCPRL